MVPSRQLGFLGARMGRRENAACCRGKLLRHTNSSLNAVLSYFLHVVSVLRAARIVCVCVRVCLCYVLRVWCACVCAEYFQSALHTMPLTTRHDPCPLGRQHCSLPLDAAQLADGVTALLSVCRLAAFPSTVSAT